MSTRGAVTLGELVGRVDRLEVRCRRCERRGRLRLAGLIADHGAATGLPDLAARLAAGCPKVAAPDLGERCFVFFPQLLEPPQPRAARATSGARMPTAARKPSPYELASSEAINAMIARVAPAILELPAARGAGERHPF